jgi:hypothetical protein
VAAVGKLRDLLTGAGPDHVETRHIVGLPVIGRRRRGFAAETPFLVLVARIMRNGQTDLFATGLYVDRIRDEAGRLRFAVRHVVCDSSRFDTLLAIPL